MDLICAGLSFDSRAAILRRLQLKRLGGLHFSDLLLRRITPRRIQSRIELCIAEFFLLFQEPVEFIGDLIDDLLRRNKKVYVLGIVENDFMIAVKV